MQPQKNGYEISENALAGGVTPAVGLRKAIADTSAPAVGCSVLFALVWPMVCRAVLMTSSSMREAALPNLKLTTPLLSGHPQYGL